MKPLVWIELLMVLTVLGCQRNEPLPQIKQTTHLQLIDCHNHDAKRYRRALKTWDVYGIDRIVLFGDISSPQAAATDDLAWMAYQRHPDRFYPFCAGIDIQHAEGVAYVKQQLEMGFYGVGEVVAASMYSPMTKNLPWKGQHPMDGFFPQVYALCAQYHAPILLHIDPPVGEPIRRLEEALSAYPDTIFIFAHANAYTIPSDLEALLRKHPNLYLDFFAGFTAYTPDSQQILADFVPLIATYPTRILLSSDSGYGIGYPNAYQAIYDLLELVAPVIRERIAWQNFDALIATQPITAYQIERIQELSRTMQIKVDYSNFNKRQANEWIFAREKER